MDPKTVYDVLEDLKGDLLAMAYELKAMAYEAYEDSSPNPTALETGKVAALDGLSSRLVTYSDTLGDAMEVLANSKHVAPVLVFEGGSHA